MGRSCTPRAASLAAYIARERWWLDDYALFHAIAASRQELSLARVAGAAARSRAARARRRRARNSAATCCAISTCSGSPKRSGRRRARAHARAASRSSATCRSWRAPTAPTCGRAPDEFLLDVSVGVPPDAFSADRAGLGLAACTSGTRSRRAATPGCASAPGGWPRSSTDSASTTSSACIARFGRPGERRAVFLAGRRARPDCPGRSGPAGSFARAALSLIAEDLGIVPDFLRPSLARLGDARLQGDAMGARLACARPAVPGSRRTIPPVSAAMTGTHDTEPLAVWWESLAAGGSRRGLCHLRCSPPAVFDPNRAGRRMSAMRCSTWRPSRAPPRSVLPIQDVFGWADRVNAPGTVRRTTGPGACRGRSRTWNGVRRARNGRPSCTRSSRDRTPAGR